MATQIEKLHVGATGSSLTRAQSDINSVKDKLSDMLCNRGHHPDISAAKWENIEKQSAALAASASAIENVFDQLDIYETLSNEFKSL